MGFPDPETQAIYMYVITRKINHRNIIIINAKMCFFSSEKLTLDGSKYFSLSSVFTEN